jgi:YHS domain-containing protein
MFMKAIIATVLTAVLATATYAGDQYVDGTGYAVSGYDVVAYFDLPQSKVGSAQPKAVPGRTELTTKYNGATFAFSSAANLERFLANPAKYAPQYDGHCAYGVAVGNKVPGNPNLWRIVGGKLYLNITKAVSKTWEKDIPGYLKQSGSNWIGKLESNRASHDGVPQFRSNAPVAN